MGANIGGIYGAQLFRADDRPRYRRGFSIASAIVAFGVACAAFRYIVGGDVQSRRRQRRRLEEQRGLDGESGVGAGMRLSSDEVHGHGHGHGAAMMRVPTVGTSADDRDAEMTDVDTDETRVATSSYGNVKTDGEADEMRKGGVIVRERGREDDELQDVGSAAAHPTLEGEIGIAR